jgi:AcrR family transcriptional regulator
MPSRQPVKQRLRSADRQRLIVQACIDAIAEQGYAATSVREIANRADVSLGTLLHHFTSKEEILRAAMDSVIETWADGARKILDGEGSPLERLDHLIEWALGDPSYDYLWRVFMAFWHEAVFDLETGTSILEGNLSWDASLAACVQDAIDAGELAGNADRISKTLSTLMYGVAVHVQGRLGRWNRATGIELCRDLLASYKPPVARR